MRRLIEQSGESQDYQTSLRIIEGFDALMAVGASVPELLAFASETTGLEAGVVDELSGIRLSHPQSATVAPQAVVLAAQEAQGLTRSAQPLCTVQGRVLACGLDYGGGRLGITWLSLERDWTVCDELTLERLSQALAIRSMQDHSSKLAPTARGELVRLLTEELNGEDRELAVTRSGLHPRKTYIVVAIREQPRTSTSPEVVAARACRQLQPTDVALGLVIGGTPFLVTSADEQACARSLRVDRPGADLAETRLDFGVSEPVVPGLLATALRQAREALVLGGSIDSDDRVQAFGDLGALHLLTHIPADQLATEPDIIAVAALEDSDSGIADLTLLEVYCQTASLRRTAQRLYLHHSSVDYRLKRIERTLGFSLDNQFGRLRGLLAARLVRMQRTRTEQR
jgi:hypothetical protein